MQEALDSGMVLWAGGTPNTPGDMTSIGMKYGPSPDRARIEAMLDDGDVLVRLAGSATDVVGIMTEADKLVPLPGHLPPSLPATPAGYVGGLPTPKPKAEDRYKPAMTPQELERQAASKTSAEEYEGVDWRLTKPEFRHEPLFQLQARDRFAAVVAEFWIALAVQHLGDDHPKIASARRRVMEIKRWQEIHGTKHPD